MLKIPESPELSRNRRGPQSGEFPHCVVCGRVIKTKKTAWIHTYYGTEAVTDAEAAALNATNGGAGDTGFFPVGNDCLRNYPELKPYVAEEG